MEDVIYRLASGVSVRNESFGLLFYCAEDTNLTFVNSGDLLDAEQLSGCQNASDLCRLSESKSKKIQKILSKLVERGLILENRISV
ncbi:MAG: mycofactocin biosynthesis chaperone MftB [Desulfobacterales bacterium]|nr:mycofactocin biosynthesis chaperone MftB [Desulfobacterales bacterium]MDD4072441.1 mycofactocin biosynthesis chaperone MftB [Desulfobacterales bacterium]MDD4392729.1 mycofactocin biosynthesis chaperone MftB [Desulfobacterales bacterium]